MPRKPKLKNPHMPTGKEPGVQYVNLSCDSVTSHFDQSRLTTYPKTGYVKAVITVWLTKEETAYNPQSLERYAFQGPGKVRYVKTANSCEVEFTQGVVTNG